MGSDEFIREEVTDRQLEEIMSDLQFFLDMDEAEELAADSEWDMPADDKEGDGILE